MAAQLSLFNTSLYTDNNKDSRIRYEIPTYIKFYSFYQYDREKFRQLLNDWLKTDEGQNRTLETLETKQNEILEECYCRDKDGNKLRDSDTKHIYRYTTLHKLQEQIYNFVVFYFMEHGIQKINGLEVYADEKQAEVTGTWDLAVKDRVIIHIRLLRLLRKGLNIKEGLCQIKN